LREFYKLEDISDSHDFSILLFLVLSPAEKVHFLLGGDSQFDDSIQVHPLFCELEELTVSPTGEMEWSEAAR